MSGEQLPDTIEDRSDNLRTYLGVEWVLSLRSIRMSLDNIVRLCQELRWQGSTLCTVIPGHMLSILQRHFRPMLQSPSSALQGPRGHSGSLGRPMLDALSQAQVPCLPGLAEAAVPLVQSEF